MKIEATSTASVSRPPPLPRRSSTIPSAPRASSRSTALRTCSLDSVVKLVYATWPNLPDLVRTMRSSTTGSRISARSSVLTNRLPSRSNVSSTRVPGAPLMSPTA